MCSIQRILPRKSDYGVVNKHIRLEKEFLTTITPLYPEYVQNKKRSASTELRHGLLKFGANTESDVYPPDR